MQIELRAPALEIAAFVATWPDAIGSLASIEEEPLVAPLPSTDEVRAAIRDALRAGGYKPSGRGKPASEYLAANPMPRINRAVDLGNRVSLASGLPISVIDFDLLAPPLAIEVAAPGTKYVFNASGQEIDASGLAILVDAHGPSGSAVKDAQRTKTTSGTRTTLSIVWGAHRLPGRAAAIGDWYRALTERAGATIR